MIRGVFAVLLLVSGVAQADYCREYTLDELKAMSTEDLQDEREVVTQKMIDAFVDDNEKISRADQLGCEAQGRVLDRLIMAHREDAERKSKAQ